MNPPKYVHPPQPWSTLRRVTLRDRRGEIGHASGFDLYLSSKYMTCPYCGVYKRYMASHIGAMRRWGNGHRRRKRAK